MGTIIKKPRRKSVVLSSLPLGAWFEYDNRLCFMPSSEDETDADFATVVDFVSGTLVKIRVITLVLPIASVTLEVTP
jgi:hypothetical protein